MDGLGCCVEHAQVVNAVIGTEGSNVVVAEDHSFAVLARLGEFQEELGELGEDGVVDLSVEEVIHEHGVVALVVTQCGPAVGAGSHEGEVEELRGGEDVGHRFGAAGSVPFAAIVCSSRAGGVVLDDEPILVLSALAFVKVEAVVEVVSHHHVTGADGSSEELDAIIRVGKDFDVVDFSVASHSAEGETIDLTAGDEGASSVANGDVTEDSAVVIVDGGGSSTVFHEVHPAVVVEVVGGVGRG